MINFTDNVGPRLVRMDPRLLLAAVGEECLHGAETVAEDAAFSIRDGSISGPGHIASAPGEPPNADTHELDASIRPIPLVETPVSVQTGVIADSEHALYMERGTSRILPRPFLEPAVERHRVEIIEAIVTRQREIRGG